MPVVRAVQGPTERRRGCGQRQGGHQVAWLVLRRRGQGRGVEAVHHDDCGAVPDRSRRPVVESDGTAVEEGAAAGRRRGRGGRRRAGVAPSRQRRSNVSVERGGLGGGGYAGTTWVRRRRRASGGGGGQDGVDGG